MTKMLDRARELTRLARESAAGELFALDKVELAIRTAAGAGAGNAKIASPLRIKSTPAAIAAADWLMKAGFSVRWTEYRPIPTGPAGDQLEIEWS